LLNLILCEINLIAIYVHKNHHCITEETISTTHWQKGFVDVSWY